MGDIVRAAGDKYNADSPCEISNPLRYLARRRQYGSDFDWGHGRM